MDPRVKPAGDDVAPRATASLPRWGAADIRAPDLAAVAQPVEHRIRNAGVGGSNPFRGTKATSSDVQRRPRNSEKVPYDGYYLAKDVHSGLWASDESDGIFRGI